MLNSSRLKPFYYSLHFLADNEVAWELEGHRGLGSGAKTDLV